MTLPMAITNQSQQTKTELTFSRESKMLSETSVLSQSVDCLPPQAQELVKEITASLSEIRASRVQALQDQIMAGMYQVDSTELAKKMLGI
jgi:flagellar biosynthesis anti-sigma factor FlgM